MRHARRGFALLMVFIVLSLLSVGLGTLLVFADASVKLTGSMVSRRASTYACQGIVVAAANVAREYYATTSAPTTAGLQAWLASSSRTGSNYSMITPAGYTVSSLTITSSPTTTTAVPNGPFEGMNAQLSPVRLTVTAQSAAGMRCAQSHDVTLAKVALFQFATFVDGVFRYGAGQPLTVEGRVHVNGKLCLGGNSLTLLGRVTSSDTINRAGNNGCSLDAGTVQIAADDTGTTLVGLTTTNDHLGAGAGWRDGALLWWNKRVRDKAHGVMALRVPFVGTPQAQAAVNNAGSVLQTTSTTRIYIDPPLPSDPIDVKQQKIAYKADLRIIDGTWYIKDPSNEALWPGKAIWSDHPGAYVMGAAPSSEVEEQRLAGSSRSIGQNDLRTALAWPATPRRFSYYETSSAGQLLDTNGATADGVISYGALFNTGVTPRRWVPGHYPGEPGATDLCTGGGSLLNNNFRAANSAAAICSAGTLPVDAGFLNATRTGFTEGHVWLDTPASGSRGTKQQSRVLPINVDIAALRAALADTTAGELGSYFCAAGGACWMKRPFNGVIWVSATWVGSLNGFAALGSGTQGAPAIWPLQGLNTNGAAIPQPGNQIISMPAVTPRPLDAVQVPNAVQPALPYPLCSSAGLGGLAGTVYSSTPGAVPFRIPSCATFNGLGARPNAVRLINGTEIPAAGLTVLTNLPLYYAGDLNTRAQNDTAAINVSSATAVPWAPFLIGGDLGAVQSNGWRDELSPWDYAPYHSRFVAVATQQNVSTLGPSGGFAENWAGKTHTTYGSNATGYGCGTRTGFNANSYLPPTRSYHYDPHLDVFNNQPPGAPLFDLQATASFSSQ